MNTFSKQVHHRYDWSPIQEKVSSALIPLGTVRPEIGRRWLKRRPTVVWRRNVGGQWQIFATSDVGVSHAAPRWIEEDLHENAMNCPCGGAGSHDCP